MANIRWVELKQYLGGVIDELDRVQEKVTAVMIKFPAAATPLSEVENRLGKIRSRVYQMRKEFCPDPGDGNDAPVPPRPVAPSESGGGAAPAKPPKAYYSHPGKVAKEIEKQKFDAEEGLDAFEVVGAGNRTSKVTMNQETFYLSVTLTAFLQLISDPNTGTETAVLPPMKAHLIPFKRVEDVIAGMKTVLNRTDADPKLTDIRDLVFKLRKKISEVDENPYFVQRTSFPFQGVRLAVRRNPPAASAAPSPV